MNNHRASSFSLMCAVILGAVGVSGDASAGPKQYGQDRCVDASCFRQEMQRSSEPKKHGYSYTPHYKVDRKDRRDDLASDKQMRRKQRIQNDLISEPAIKRKKSRQAQSDWKLDSDKHKRRRKPDSHYRFDYGGYSYPDSRYSISCREGRQIVRGHGFYSANALECQGRTFTYLVRKDGETFRVIVDSRYGRIISVRPL